MAQELNFDGLVGPVHNYAGFVFGNLASTEHHGTVASPRQAALQGLAKMRILHDLGVPQAVIPPQRPDLTLPRRLGWRGDDATILADLAREAPLMLAVCYTPSSMWTANAATVSPSADSADGKVHITPANLQNKLHRSIETASTARILRAIFRDPEYFVLHDPLPATAQLGDEGAANHTRLAPSHGARGVQLFVHGESAINPWAPRPKMFPARQTFEANMSLQRLHMVAPAQVVHAQQNPTVIDQGVFHNDVISVGHLGVFLCHELAFRETDKVLAELREKYTAVTGGELRVVVVRDSDVPVPVAVSTYLFNSQIVTTADGTLTLIAPRECEENERVRETIDRLIAEGPIAAVRFVELRQSMHNGGGPACLRLRVVLRDDELAAINPGVRFSDELETALRAWIERHYRDRMAPSDLADPSLLREAQETVDGLTRILGLAGVYDFQR